jgi:methylmalonyl-CoA mutase C-terminal domain/subunit
MAQPIRVVLTKPGIDGHDVGVKIVARGLRDAGMEVIYTGLRVEIAEAVRTALQEDAQVIGIANASGQHVAMAQEMQRQLAEAGADDILVIVGGNLLKEDIDRLKEMGIEGAFAPGTSIGKIVDFINANLPSVEAREGS